MTKKWPFRRKKTKIKMVNRQPEKRWFWQSTESAIFDLKIIQKLTPKYINPHYFLKKYHFRNYKKKNHFCSKICYFGHLWIFLRNKKWTFSKKWIFSEDIRKKMLILGEKSFMTWRQLDFDQFGLTGYLCVYTWTCPNGFSEMT